MKITLTFYHPLDRKQKFIKSFYVPDSLVIRIEDFINRIKESMIILSADVFVEHDDGTSESTTVFLSTLCEKENRQINKFTKTEAAPNVIVNKEIVKESMFERIKSVLWRK